MFDKLRDKVTANKTKIKVAAATSLPVVVASVSSVNAFAAEESTNIRTTMVSSFTTIGSDILGFFGDILPIALPILGAALVISVGIGIFKKVTHKACNG